MVSAAGRDRGGGTGEAGEPADGGDRDGAARMGHRTLPFGTGRVGVLPWGHPEHPAPAPGLRRSRWDLPRDTC